MYCPHCDLDGQTGAFCKKCGKFLDPNSKPGNSVKPESVESSDERPDSPTEETSAAAPDEDIANESKASESAAGETSTSLDEETQPKPSAGQESFPESTDEPLTNVVNPVTTKRSLGSVISRLWDFKGKTTRRGFGWFVLSSGAISLLLVSIGQLDGLSNFLAAIYLLSAASLGTRRLRDAGLSQYFWLFMLLPVLGIVVLSVMMSLPTRSTHKARVTSSDILISIVLSLCAIAVFLFMATVMIWLTQYP